MLYTLTSVKFTLLTTVHRDRWKIQDLNVCIGMCIPSQVARCGQFAESAIVPVLLQWSVVFPVLEKQHVLQKLEIWQKYLLALTSTGGVVFATCMATGAPVHISGSYHALVPVSAPGL